jgi:DNA-binding PadR family transcriptional regulator
MELTRRQEDFFNKLLDMYRELKGPIHYSALAEHLNVSPFTAYDMLRLLEEKGFVTSEYRLAPDKSGPGRTERVFLPTQQAHEVSNRLAAETGGADWETFKQHVLEKIRTGEMEDKELSQEMLKRIPSEENQQLQYCVEVMTIVALRLRSAEGRRVLLEYLPEILPFDGFAHRANLSLLGGFSLGVLANEGVDDREWGQQLFEHVQQYLDNVMSMNDEDCRSLGEHLVKVFAPLGEN